MFTHIWGLVDEKQNEEIGYKNYISIKIECFIEK